MQSKSINNSSIYVKFFVKGEGIVIFGTNLWPQEQLMEQAAPEQSIQKAGGAQAGKKLLARDLGVSAVRLSEGHIFPCGQIMGT